MMKVSLACIFDRDGKIIFERKVADHPREPGALCFVGGAAENGEDSIQCLRRELAEELSYSISGFDHVELVQETTYVSDLTGQEFDIAYFLVLLAVDDVILPEGFLAIDHRMAGNCVAPARKDIIDLCVLARAKKLAPDFDQE